MSISSLLACCVIACMVLGTPALGATAVVKDGKPLAVVVVPAGDGENISETASELVAYVEVATGTGLQIVPEDSGELERLADGIARIHVGLTQRLLAAIPSVNELHQEGFVVRSAGDGEIFIAGPTDAGTRFGVYEFLERHAGVRWLLPGPDGTSVPRVDTIEVPDGEIRQQPAFLSRKFSGLSTQEEGLWSRQMRMSSRVRFHHYLLQLFPTERYAESHPEFYPFIDGKRRIPTPSIGHSWQPCFTAPGSAAATAAFICEYLDANPAAESVSLGINDSGTDGWCQCDTCRDSYSGETNFIGTPDYSDPYYAWCGEVIDGVLVRHPDIWFGCLAYNNVIDPPEVGRVHPRLIPYITLDRMQWAQPALREHGYAMNRRWQQASETLGWYDYIYGRQYSLPRVYCRQMGENLRFASRNGVRAFYAEAYPNWGEGPKLYVTAKLLWDPDTDVDATLRDWYANCAGPGADDLARYYDHWEDFWTRRVHDTGWFGGAEILAFNSQEYINAVSLAEMAQCRRWLESALAKTETDDQRARVGSLLASFEGYESAVLYQKVNGCDGEPAELLRALLDTNPPATQARKAKALVAVLDGSTKPVTRNPSFETGDAGPHNWMLWVKPAGDPPYGEMVWAEAADARTGTRVLRVKGLKRGGPVQAMKLSPGTYIMLVGYRMPRELSRNKLEMSVLLKDSRNASLSFGMQPNEVFVKLQAGGWRVAVRPFTVPAQVGGTDVASVQFAPVLEDLLPEDSIEFDDVGIYRVGD